MIKTRSALQLLQRIRDEAHRFAITFHRQSRTKRDLRSELDVIPGIGVRRRKTLLTTFGSLAGVRRATREELANDPILKARYDAAVAESEAYAQISAKAREYRIPILNQNRFLYLIGYYNQAKR